MFISRQLIVQICLICLLSYIYDINSFKALRKHMKKSLHHHILVSTSKDSIKLMNNIENRNAIEFQNDKKLQDNNNNNNSNKSKSFLWTSFPFLALLAFTVAPAFANDFSSLALSSATLNMELVSKYFLAGGVSCSISHGLSVPFDVVKTRKQVSKEMTGLSIVEVFKKIVLDDGLLMLFKGLGPTLIGYSVQGALKFGFYEIFKTTLMAWLAPQESGRLIVFMLAGGLADTIASSVLTPFEACRIRLVADPSFANGLIPCLQKITSIEGTEGLFRGLPAILAKQIPYTVVCLSVFESVASSTYSYLADHGIPANEWKFGVTIASSIIAAVLSSLASQPGDTLLSVVNKKARVRATVDGATSSISTSGNGFSATLGVMKDSITELGVAGLFTGTKARLVHVTVMVVIQLFVYDYVKTLFGIPVTGYH